MFVSCAYDPWRDRLSAVSSAQLLYEQCSQRRLASDIPLARLGREVNVMIYVLTMMNLMLRMMKFALKLMNFALKI